MDNSIDSTVVLFIVAALFVFSAVSDLIQIMQTGIMKDKRVLLMKKTKAELKSMLKGEKGISSKNKSELIDLIVA